MRFRDVVGAYKTTLKEKAALESTIKTLTSGEVVRLPLLRVPPPPLGLLRSIALCR